MGRGLSGWCLLWLVLRWWWYWCIGGCYRKIWQGIKGDGIPCCFRSTWLLSDQDIAQTALVALVGVLIVMDGVQMPILITLDLSIWALMWIVAGVDVAAFEWLYCFLDACSQRMILDNCLLSWNMGSISSPVQCAYLAIERVSTAFAFFWRYEFSISNPSSAYWLLGRLWCWFCPTKL